MPSASSIRAGKAFVELSTRDKGLVKGLRAAEKKLRAFGSSIAALGARLMTLGTAATAALYGASRAFASLGDKLGKASKRTNVAVEDLSNLAIAAELSGADLDTLELGLRKMAQTIVDAADGSQTAVRAMQRLGLSIADLDGLSPDRQFKLIADRLSQIRNPTLRAALALDIFGRSGTRLLPLIADGAAGIERLEEQARKLGLTWSTEDAAAAEAFTDTLTLLWRVMQRSVAVIGGALAPVFEDLAQHVTKAVSALAKWLNENRNLVQVTLRIAAAITAGGFALLLLGKVIVGVGAALGLAATVIVKVSAAIGLLTTLAGALATPIGVVSVGLASLAAYLVYVSGVGGKSLAWLGERFEALKTTATAAWQGISDALAAGDLGLAAQIAWLSLKLVWKQGIGWLEERWISFKHFFIEVFRNAVYILAGIFVDAWFAIQAAWLDTTTFMANAWTKFITILQRSWNRFAGFFARVWARIKGLFGADAEAEIARINEEEARREQDILEQQSDTLAARNRQHEQRRSQLEREHAGTREALEQMQDLERRQRETMTQRDIAQTQQELEEARRQFQDALLKARRLREGADGRPQLLKRMEELPDIEAIVEMTQRKVDVGGTFSALAVRGLGATSLAERTARATEQVAVNTKRLVDKAKAGGLVFA
ncbi:MAG: hypothetical protein KatS3mg109_0643 [Pirellulaceae bacterium]|nr:MAG: hypothetical protein KatS3mg109_0643 [Pirellulaceae bacterium]